MKRLCKWEKSILQPQCAHGVCTFLITAYELGHMKEIRRMCFSLEYMEQEERVASLF